MRILFISRILENGEGKGGKYLEKENMLFGEEIQNGESKCIFCAGEENQRRKGRKKF